MLAACGGGGGGAGKKGPVSVPPPVSTCNDSIEYCGDIPAIADTCEDPQFWPLNASSALYPVTVHFPRVDDESKALEIIAFLDESWSVQVDQLGFTPPIDDGGECGPDGNFDVFIWRGIDGAYVSGISEVPATPHDDWTTFMAIDPSGSVGNRLLDTYIAHELNHALQAGDDWWEEAPHYEAGATFAEALVYPDQRDYFFTLEDFQANPGWSLFYNDSFATWYMYGAAMYLHFLYERHFAGDPAFYRRIWFATRSPPSGNRPDYIDALRSVLLSERGLSLEETVVEFSQWRWFVGEYDDGAHFENGADWSYPVAFDEADAAALPPSLELSAMMYGASYLRITNGGDTPVDVIVTLDYDNPLLDWRLVEVSHGHVTAPLTIPPAGAVVVAAVLLPVDEVWTDTISFHQFAVELTLALAP